MNHQIEVPAVWSSLRPLLAFSDSLEIDFALSIDQRYLMRLAIEEIATNIVKYSYSERPGIIQLTCSYDDGILRLIFRDRGRPFPPDAWPSPDLGDSPAARPIGGLGLFLLRDLADSLDYRHDGTSGWNELVILKGPGARSA